MKRKESEIKMDYIEPNMEVIWLDAKEDVIRTSGLNTDGDSWDDSEDFPTQLDLDETFK